MSQDPLDNTEMMKMMMMAKQVSNNQAEETKKIQMQKQQQQQQQQQTAPPQPSPYDKTYISSKNALDSSFILKGMKYRGIKWKLEQDLLSKYNKRMPLPDYNKIAISDLII